MQQRGGVSKVRCLAATRYSDVALNVQLGEVQEFPEWEYTLVFSQDKQRRPIVKGEVVMHDGKVIMCRPNENDKKDPELLTQTHLEQVTTNKEFRAVVDFLSSIKYMHVVPQLIREPDRSVGKKDDPFGGDFLEQLAKTKPKFLDSRLAKINKALKIVVPNLDRIEIERDEKGTPHLKGLFKHWRPNAGWQGEDQFSDGTLRLLGLLWSLFQGEGPLLLEEPELSLHNAVVRHIPQMLARLSRKLKRQLIISTHSYEMLTDSGIAPEEAVILIPTESGTKVEIAANNLTILDTISCGESLAEAVFQVTAPAHAHQLPLFVDER